MNKAAFELFLQEANKVLTMDQSHSAIRDKLQTAVTTQHRIDNPESDSYYGSPYVQDVFGNEDSGQVVHSKGGKNTMSDYKSNGSGGYDVKNHRSVKRAYVADSSDGSKSKTLKESLSCDGSPVLLDYETPEFEEVHSVELQESASAGGNKSMKVTLITAGTGSMGHYTESALAKAAKDGIFHVGLPMFLNHQTKEERVARPEGDVTKMAAKLSAPATYVPPANGKPGRLTSEATVYADFVPFIKARKDDLGLSVRVGVTPSAKIENGKPLVENMVYAASTDFVTVAGRGGKIEEMYESFRSTQAGERKMEDEVMTDEEKKLLTSLQEGNAKLLTRLDRMEEENHALRAGQLVSEALTGTGLNPKGQARVRKEVLAALPLTDGKLDVTKFQESLKTAITEEVAYLQESGARVSPHLIKGHGAGTPEKATEDALLEESGKTFDSSIDAIMGRPKKEVAKSA